MSPPLARFFVGLAVFTIAAPFVVLGARSAQRELRLRDGGESTWAVVTGRADRRRIRYEFQRDGEWCSRRGLTGARGVWSWLGTQGVAEADDVGMVSVVFLPSDPWVNRPLHEEGSPLFDALAAVALFGFMAVLGFVLLAFSWHEWRLSRAGEVDGF